MLDIVRDKVIAFRATIDYTKSRIRRDELVTKTSVGYVTGAEKAAYEQEIIELNERMRSNPLETLIEANMYQTLVEDINTDDDLYTYKSKVANSLAEKTQMLSPIVGTVAKNFFLTHDTTAYKVLNKATMMSDFTSRYVMYKHLTERTNNPLSSEAALREARKAFVNYDTPTHKAIQYLNDMGLLWFTKYYLRIQAVILQLIRDNPLRAVALSGFDFFTDISDILDSGAFQNSPLNFGTGALEIWDSTKEIITVNAVL